MDGYQAIERVFQLGYRYARQIARVRVGIGIWLLFLTGVLYGSGHGGRWGWLLVVGAALHFALAYRLSRIATNDSDRRMRLDGGVLSAARPRRRLLGRVLGSALVVALVTAGWLSAGPPAGASSEVPNVSASIVGAPVRVAHTTLGTVAYRTLGSGPALLLIMGYAGTMETWDPLFVDTLARHYRVVIFDNAGTGATRRLPGQLTIDAMAAQTSALINALRLGRTNVLGWSMGGMIAQALAVTHPGQVRRLVLCATFPGTGRIVKPPQKQIDALTSGNPQATSAALFPADQAFAFNAMSAELSLYPAHATAPATTIAAQGSASLQWFAGRDTAGRETARIAAPTLIADGAEDRLDATFNGHVLAGLIRHSTLLLYPDAGHAFLFQEGVPFLARVETFLSGAPPDEPLAVLRTAFRADQARELAAGLTWVHGLKVLAKDAPHTSGQVAQARAAALDAPYVSTLAAIDDGLLGVGTQGRLGAAVVRLVDADQLLIEDVAALPELAGAQRTTWGPTFKRNGLLDEAASKTLDNDLRLPFPTGATGTS
jgi:pimeloyl-ACP methyl ester carboxylesterase